MNSSLLFTHSILAASALLLSACAAVPLAPADALQAADIAISNADKERAADAAPLEMRTAHEKITAARDSREPVDERSVMQARWLADEARADADLATAKARLAQANIVNQQLQKGSNTLRQETERGSGV